MLDREIGRSAGFAGCRARNARGQSERRACAYERAKAVPSAPAAQIDRRGALWCSLQEMTAFLKGYGFKSAQEKRM